MLDGHVFELGFLIGGIVGAVVGWVACIATDILVTRIDERHPVDYDDTLDRLRDL